MVRRPAQAVAHPQVRVRCEQSPSCPNGKVHAVFSQWSIQYSAFLRGLRMGDVRDMPESEAGPTRGHFGRHRPLTNPPTTMCRGPLFGRLGRTRDVGLRPPPSGSTCSFQLPTGILGWQIWTGRTVRYWVGKSVALVVKGLPCSTVVHVVSPPAQIIIYETTVPVGTYKVSVPPASDHVSRREARAFHDLRCRGAGHRRGMMRHVDLAQTPQ